MIATYAIPAVPLQAQIPAVLMLGSIGWAALVALGVGAVAIAVLTLRERRQEADAAVADAAELQPPLAA